jgi:hypothetical protein
MKDPPTPSFPNIEGVQRVEAKIPMAQLEIPRAMPCERTPAGKISEALCIVEVYDGGKTEAWR